MTDTLNDKEKLDLWNKVCLEKGWSGPRELEKWLLHSEVSFSNNGSAVPGKSMSIDNKYNLDIVINAVEGEGLATLVLEALSGVLVFGSVDLEKMFWNIVGKRLKAEFQLTVPTQILSKYIKNDENPKQFEMFD